MDNDAPRSTITGPATHRIADVNEANLAFLRHALGSMDRRIGRHRAFDSNAEGHFAWDVSLFIRAACLG